MAESITVPVYGSPVSTVTSETLDYVDKYPDRVFVLSSNGTTSITFTETYRYFIVTFNYTRSGMSAPPFGTNTIFMTPGDKITFSVSGSQDFAITTTGITLTTSGTTYPCFISAIAFV